MTEPVILHIANFVVSFLSAHAYCGRPAVQRLEHLPFHFLSKTWVNCNCFLKVFGRLYLISKTHVQKPSVKISRRQSVIQLNSLVVIIYRFEVISLI